MKNKLLTILSIFCIAFMALGLTACGGGNDGGDSGNPSPDHTHAYDTLKYDSENHWYECVCGEKNSIKAHKGGTATETEKAVCSVCEQEYGNLLTHTHAYDTLKYDSENHWYECACGEKNSIKAHKGGTATETEKAVCSVCKQEYGNILIHNHTYNILKYNSKNHWNECACGEKSSVEAHKGGNATCKTKARCIICAQEYGELVEHNPASTWTITNTHHYKLCSAVGCQEKIDYSEHTFTNYLSDGNATYQADGTKTASCNGGCGKTDTVIDVGSKLFCGITFNTLTVDGNSVYGKVSNTTETFSFLNEVTALGGAKFVVSLDIYGMQQVATKTIPLSTGDNKVYVIEMVDNEVSAVYEVTVRRKPIYNVTFETNGGTAVETQTVEEDAFAIEPSYNPTRVGYTFTGWDYNFETPITQNTVVTANWQAKSDTKYTVNYYLQKLEDNNYALYETEELEGITDTTATAVINEYTHFTYNESASTISGNINADGSLILNVYYTRNVYTLNTNLSSVATVTNLGEYEYGVNGFESTLTNLKLGYNFIGWYSGEELLSTETTYAFTVDKNVTATFEIDVAISNFNFTSTLDTCDITGVKDKTVTEIIVPSYVTLISRGAFSGCSSLESITLPFVGASLNGTSDTHFGYIFGAINYFDNDDYVPASLKTVVITGGTSIGSDAFRGCTSLTSIEIPNSVTSIGEDAFYRCSSLTCITLPFVGVSTTASNGYKKVFGYIFGYITSSYSSAISGVTYQYNFGSTYYHYYIPTSLKTVIITGGTSIPYQAFYNCSSLESIEIPSSVTSIGYQAFYNCSSLESIEIPSSVTSIGYQAFYYCSSLTSIEIPSSVTSIGSDAFRGCTSLTSIEIPNSVTSIGERAFYNCRSLESVTFGENSQLTSIGEDAFEDCSSLESIEIPSGVTSIGSSAFESCDSLESVYYLGSIEDWCSINFLDGYSNPLYYRATLYINNEPITEVVIPNTVTEVKPYVFKGGNFTSIEIPDSVTSISDYAFYGCTSLTSIEIPSGVTSIGYQAFYYCSSLTSIVIPSSVTNIGYQAFAYCSSLETIEILSSVTSIGNYAFRDCTSLTSIEIPNSVTSIGNYAFYYCTSLTSIEIPNSVTSIGEGAFYGCSSIESVHIENIAVWCNIDFAGGYYSNPLYNGATLYINNDPITELVIPNTVTELPSYAFYGQDTITSIEIPNSVTSIGRYAFYDCDSLTSVTIGNSVTSIGYDAFSGCCKLVEVYNLSNLDVSSYFDYELDIYTSLDTPSKLTTTVDGFVLYSDAVNGVYKLISYVGSDTDITLPSNINGNNYEINSYAFIYCSSLTSIEIPNNVTSIGDLAFFGCSSLTSIEIPDSVTSIGNSTFYNCSSLESIEIPSSVTSIGDYAFQYCYSLESVYYLGGIEEWCNIDFASGYSNPLYNGATLYINNDPITELVIPNTVTEIPFYAFYGQDTITSIEIPSSVTSIGYGAFCNCDSLESVTFGENSQLTSIGEDAFRYCSSLTSIEIPNSVTSIGSHAFYYCSSLTSIEIPNSVTRIAYCAFYECSSLTSITFEDTSTWYRIHCNSHTFSEDWQNKTGGTQTNVSNPTTNDNYFKTTYYDYYWYKK